MLLLLVATMTVVVVVVDDRSACDGASVVESMPLNNKHSCGIGCTATSPSLLLPSHSCCTPSLSLFLLSLSLSSLFSLLLLLLLMTLMWDVLRCFVAVVVVVVEC